MSPLSATGSLPWSPQATSMWSWPISFSVANVPIGRVPTVFFSHNVEYLIWKRLADVETHPIARAVMAVEWRKVRRR